MGRSILWFVMSCALAVVSAKKWPERVPRCKLASNAELEKCLTEIAETHRDMIVKGIQELQIPPLDPLELPELELDNKNSTSAVGVQAVFKNIVIKGGKNYKIRKINVDTEDVKLRLEVSVPALDIEADYELEGRIMVLQLKGSGRAKGNFTNLDGMLDMHGKYVTKKNKKYIEWTERSMELNIDKASMYFANLFAGNQALTDSTNQVINENVDVLMVEFKPLIQETLATLIFSTVKRLFNLYSFDQILLT